MTVNKVKLHELHRLGKLTPNNSVKKHPHHRGENISKSKIRQVEGGLKEFR